MPRDHGLRGMKFNKIRLLGFKSFVEPTEFLIENGLTGIVGPNGCGKSNMVEALRWVMGENSYKNMRASGMDDVIFSGSGNRPARNTAEVSLFLDNTSRTAPSAFNDADELQVSRRIERDSGSVYRINGREVRAKDVQLLFADASTGARSPSMVGQGRIGELISAKPQARRALLEEAAGISGLHSRRHEAELRLRAAEQNLERLEDIIAQMDSQLESLKRQARQANRYRSISAEIRRSEALLLHLRWVAAKTAEGDAQSALSRASAQVGEKAEAQAQSAKEQAVIASRLPELRDTEAKAAAALQRLTIARNQIEEEIERMAARKRELEQRIGHLDSDIERETRMITENGEVLERLADEERELNSQAADTEGHAEELNATFLSAEADVARTEDVQSRATAELAAHRASRDQMRRAMDDATGKGQRLDEQMSRVEAELAEIEGKIASLGGFAEKQDRVSLLEKRAEDAEADALSAERRVEAARQAQAEAGEPLAAAQTELNRIETEARTLNGILNQSGHDLFPGIVEKVRVEPGFETALGAALGEDLDIPVDPSAPAHWSRIEALADDAALPEGARPLVEVVGAPSELARRLAQIGIVDTGQGSGLQKLLKPGQRLVSVEGDLWRWDGFVASADAPSAAAQRLAQKNRLAELDREALAARDVLKQAEQAAVKAREATAEATEEERAARDAWRQASQELANARQELAEAERAVNQFTSRKAALDDAKNRISTDIQDNRAVHAEAEAGLAALPDLAGLESDLNTMRSELAEKRARLAEARAAVEGQARESAARAKRLAAITQERTTWTARAENATAQIETLKARRTESATELEQLAEAPGEVEQRRNALMNQVGEADATRKSAADALAAAESELAQADAAAKAALASLSEAREARARAEERATAATERRGEAEVRIREELDCHPADALGLAEHDEGKPFPEAGSVERQLEKLKNERERLGAVNLRAEAEQVEISERRDALTSERDDLIAAIQRLRQGISSLNKEGRERLLEAFEAVNSHFRELFTHLFGGGTAELQLVESDDPLDAGLEILARPPGKRPQTMTLLSGGEQALTAMALIFAVFLTNPAPICVLDEVDAPLDDQNVERFCNLMDQMVKSTETRFVIVTHNPITMARMNRLFGVTMAERGVSQLVSVNLEQAEELREAV